ncbi:N-6 DNA methylase, partial [Listeria monocytogenes]
MKQMSGNLSEQKLRGGYYTPQEITNFLCKWAIDRDSMKILEPSCGDGNFLESAINRMKSLNIQPEDIEKRITGIELIKDEAISANKRIMALGIKSNLVVNSDFFQYIKKNNDKKFDVVVGNPPFIRYQNFPEKHREIAIDMMQELGLKPNKLTNIWVPFLVKSASILTDNGKLAMVIPAELFQVKYAAETRIFLSTFFKRITIVTFKKLVFQDIQQEVVLLLCEKETINDEGIRVIECENLEDLESLNLNLINNLAVKPLDHSSEKWTKYFLNNDEIVLLRNLKDDSRIISCGDIFKSEVGLVTGRNEFFMMKKKDVEKWNLEEYTIPVVSKSNQLQGITFSDNDFQENSVSQKAIYLFLPPDKDFEELPKTCQDYIKYGEEKGFHTGYKTRIRKRWYITPSRWIPDAFA